MHVRELIEALSGADPDAAVVVASWSGGGLVHRLVDDTALPKGAAHATGRYQQERTPALVLTAYEEADVDYDGPTAVAKAAAAVSPLFKPGAPAPQAEEEPEEFQVGDRVRILAVATFREHDPKCVKLIGHTGTVVDTDPTNPDGLHVRVDAGSSSLCTWWYDRCSLEHVAEEEPADTGPTVSTFPTVEQRVADLARRVEELERRLPGAPAPRTAGADLGRRIAERVVELFDEAVAGMVSPL